MTTIKLFLWSRSKFSSRSKIIPVNNKIKGQLISEWNFGVFKSPKKPTKFLTDFCPSFIKFILRLTVDIESSRSWGKKSIFVVSGLVDLSDEQVTKQIFQYLPANLTACLTSATWAIWSEVSKVLVTEFNAFQAWVRTTWSGLVNSKINERINWGTYWE